MSYSDLVSLGISGTLSTSLVYSDLIQSNGKVVEVQIRLTGGSGDTDDVEVYQFNCLSSPCGLSDNEGKLLGTITLNGDTEVVKSFSCFINRNCKIGLKMEFGSTETPSYKWNYVLNNAISNKNFITPSLPTEFIFTVKTDNAGTSNDDQFTLPLKSGKVYNCLINWGDETSTNQTTTVSPTHTYAASGTYTITISGTFPSIYFNNGGDKSKLVSISNFGKVGWNSFENSLYGCANLISVSNLNTDTSSVTSMSFMFANCIGLTSLDLSLFDTSSVTDMSFMFSNSTSLLTIDLSSFDTSSVTDMSSMFRLLTSLNTLDLSSFDTASVTDMSLMFSDCSSLTSLDVSSFDTASVTDMSLMFSDCSSLTSLDLSSFDTAAVKDMKEMFHTCSSLTSLDLSSFDTSSVTDMKEMFDNCSSLISLDLSSFDTSSVTDMSLMFGDCQLLVTLNISSFDTSSVTDMSFMFADCSSLTPLSLVHFNTSNVDNMKYMFRVCSALTSLDLSSFDTSNVTDMSFMFYNCNALTSLDLSSFDTSAVLNMDSMFYGVIGFDQNIGSWVITSVTDMTSMFLNVTISTINYSNILTGWESQAVQNNVNFNGGNSEYSAGAPATARAALIADHTWTITDGGQE